MWLFTTLGFFSVTRSKDEPDRMQIRAREKGDLEGLIATLGIGEEILETPTADYRWRIIVDHAEAVGIISAMVSMIDYSNFKDAVHAMPGQESKSVPYMRIWSIMNGLQGGTAGTPPPMAPASPIDPNHGLDLARAGAWTDTVTLAASLDAELVGRVIDTEPDGPYPGGYVRVISVGSPNEKAAYIEVVIVAHHPDWKTIHLLIGESVRLMPAGTEIETAPVDTKDALRNPKARKK